MPRESLKFSKDIIIRFDKTNINNFLESVSTAIDMADTVENKSAVLKYAKQRVTNSILIESKTYVDFADFKRDVLATFKPKRTVTDIESIISRLTQNDRESVDEYAKRVFVLGGYSAYAHKKHH